MLKSIKHIRKKTLIALLHATFIPSLVSASEKEFSINDLNSQSLNSSSKIVQSIDLIDVDYDITRVYSYYKSAYPQSPYASLDENKTYHLLRMATVIKQAIESIESGEALKRALHEVTTIPLTVNFKDSKKEIKREEPSLSYVLTYYQNANKQGSYARLDQNETQHLLRMATIIKHLAPDLSPGDALNHALRILFSEPIKQQLIQIVKEEKKSQSGTQTVKLDSDLIQKLNYFKSHYPHSPYANLNTSHEQELLRIASSLKQANSESGMESTTALGLALAKLFPNSIKSVNNSQEDYLEQRKVMQQKILGNVEGNRPQRLEELEKKKKEELEEKEKLRAFKEDMYQKPVDEVFIPGSGWVLKSQSELVNGEWKLKSNRKENNTNNNNAPGLDYEATDTLKSMINDHLHVEELKNIGYTQAQINWVNNQKNKNDDPNKMRLNNNNNNNNNNMNETVNQDLNIVQTSPNYWTINGKDVDVVTLMGNTYLSFKNIGGGICGAIAIGIDPREKKNKQIIQKAAKNAGEEFRQLFNQNPLMVPTLDDEIMTELARANNINLKIIENHADEYHSYIDINEYRNGKRIILLSTGEHFTLLVPTRDLNNDLIKLGLAQQDLASKVDQNNYYIKLNEFLNK